MPFPLRTRFAAPGAEVESAPPSTSAPSFSTRLRLL